MLSTSLNWYVNYNIRFMLEWDRVLHTKAGTVTTATSKGLDIISFRVQFNL